MVRRSSTRSQSLHGEPISLPSHRADRPDRELLEERLGRRAAV